MVPKESGLWAPARPGADNPQMKMHAAQPAFEAWLYTVVILAHTVATEMKRAGCSHHDCNGRITMAIPYRQWLNSRLWQHAILVSSRKVNPRAAQLPLSTYVWHSQRNEIQAEQDDDTQILCWANYRFPYRTCLPRQEPTGLKLRRTHSTAVFPTPTIQSFQSCATTGEEPHFGTLKPEVDIRVLLSQSHGGWQITVGPAMVLG